MRIISTRSSHVNLTSSHIMIGPTYWRKVGGSTILIAAAKTPGNIHILTATIGAEGGNHLETQPPMGGNLLSSDQVKPCSYGCFPSCRRWTWCRWHKT